MILNPSSKEPVEIDISGKLLKPKDSLIYLGLPIGPSVRAIRQLLKSFFAEKIRKAYIILIVLNHNFFRTILGKRKNKHKGAVVNAFNGSATNLLITECDDCSYSQESLLNLHNSLLSSIIQLGSKKKIILIYQKEMTNVLADNF